MKNVKSEPQRTRRSHEGHKGESLATDGHGFTRILLFLFVFAAVSVAQEKKTAEVIYVNGRVYTGAGAFRSWEPRKDCTRPRFDCGAVEWVVGAAKPQYAEVIAVADGRVIGIGLNHDARAYQGTKTKMVDLHGAFVMPGFNDAHVHLASGGFEKLNVNLTGSKSLAEMKQRIAAAAKDRPAGEWLQGRGWDHTKWAKSGSGDATLPTRQDMDAVTGDHPAIFGRVDGHIAVANTAALKAAGVTGKTKVPNGGAIDVDAQGEPTGILREGARELVYSKIPPPTPAQRRRGLELALADAAEQGITSAQDNSEWEDFLVYEELEREGKLTLRIAEWLPFKADLKLLQEHRAHHPATDAMLHTTMLKGFMDGSLGSRTAALLAPYSDDPKNSGLPQFRQHDLEEMTWERVNAGFQIGFHAIGDRGAALALAGFGEAWREWHERAQNRNKTPDFRFRIEHAQVIAPDQFQTMHELGVIASVQPNHLLTDMNWAEARIGAERAKTSYPWREFLQNEIPLAFGTDYPVEPITPFRGLYAAVTRKNEAGTKTYYPEQKLTIDEAIAAYTSGSAYAEFAEKDKGMLAPGMLADFVVLDRDITKVAPEEILKTKVLRTVVGGRTVYEAK
ncbi:MAG: amidohydrolase [Candidatus Koribacter versatilis]|uniref:Amidohydrolase n=1 Tax=Candidatus Korobacter versatilis TaxID=658062 RepID=A0A932A7V1_9BACT|nr:amidohydrolase [Candidatus Koribacter versatilis]